MGGAEQWCASNRATSHASVQEGPEGAVVSYPDPSAILYRARRKASLDIKWRMGLGTRLKEQVSRLWATWMEGWPSVTVHVSHLLVTSSENGRPS